MSYAKNRLAAQPPLTKVNHEYYNPLVHTPPTGLEKNIILRSLGPRQPVTVTQNQTYKTKIGEDANKDEDYGQFVELGGRRRKKTKKNKRKTKSKKSISKKSISKRNKSKRKNRR
jgi:hypothetical protein